LKERAKILASHALGKLCCRCDVYYEDEEEQPRQFETGENDSKKEKKAHLGICNRCKAQLA